MRRLIPLTLAAALLVAALATAGKKRFTIRGAGFGHGIGMSQYGAYGYALHGATYDAILRHYYTGTSLGQTDPSTTVRVLLQSSSSGTFSGATRAGARRVSPGVTYRASNYGAGQVALYRGSKRLATVSGPLQVAPAAGGVLSLGGVGQYRGRLEFRPSTFGGINTVNLLPLEQYVAGVVARESPSSWPIEALKAQAVAARTYAVTTSKAGDGFDQYADTRSQVYGGVAAETPSTNAAVTGTRGQVVTYAGQPVVTYFFSTSGGRTENVENSFLGSQPEPWLKSVADPYDSVSPKHRWRPVRMTLAAAGAKLSGLVKGRFKGIRVTKRGVSPRIMYARVIGTRGSTRVTGATLRARLGLLDTWASFTSITTNKKPPPTGSTGGASPPPPATAAGPHARAILSGRVYPEQAGPEIQVQVRDGRTWRTVTSTDVRGGGYYAAAVSRPGTYRVIFSGDAGASITVR
jgi:stage II sporulation protein D